MNSQDKETVIRDLGMLTRYECELTDQYGYEGRRDPQATMEKDTDGDYLKFHDVLVLIESL